MPRWPLIVVPGGLFVLLVVFAWPESDAPMNGEDPLRLPGSSAIGEKELGRGLESSAGERVSAALAEPELMERPPETSTESPIPLEVESTSDESIDEVEFSRRKLVASMELFRADRSLTNAQNLMQRTVVAWADLSGTAEHYDPDDPVPEQELTEEVWSIWVTNRFGSKLVKYTRAEFPEYFEIRDLPRAGQSIFDLELDEDILRRVEQRAQTVLDLLGED